MSLNMSLKTLLNSTFGAGQTQGPTATGGLVVRAEGVTKTYGVGGTNPVEVLHGVDLAVSGGEFVAIIGQSGSGKSTLLNLLGALDRPTKGIIAIDGQDIGRLDSRELARLRNTTIGFIYQFHHLLDEFNCLENVLMPLIIRRGRPLAADRAWAEELLARVGMVDQRHKHPSQLSGGQQQRCAIVRALAGRPRLVLADEPTGNLDRRTGGEVFALLREMNRDMGTAFIMITHDERLSSAADRVLRMEDGLLHEV